MDFVIHHVLQTLIVSWTQENLGVQLSTCETIIQHLQETNRQAP